MVASTYGSQIIDDLSELWAPPPLPIAQAFFMYTVESDAKTNQGAIRATVAAIDSQFLRHPMKVFIVNKHYILRLRAHYEMERKLQYHYPPKWGTY